MSASLEVSREGRILRLKLNRSEKRNALDAATCRALVENVRGAERDSGVGAILLEAAGNVFSAGMDLDEALSADAGELALVHDELFTLGSQAALPIVAAINGPALGGGLGLVANAHVAVAAQGSSFGLTEVRVGMWPFVVYRAMALAIGERRTVELSLTGRLFGTQEALQWGLVQFVVPVFELEDRAVQIAEGIAASAPEMIRRGMEFVRKSRGLDWEAAGELALAARREAFASGEFREGVAAFLEKRKAVWPQMNADKRR